MLNLLKEEKKKKQTEVSKPLTFSCLIYEFLHKHNKKTHFLISSLSTRNDNSQRKPSSNVSYSQSKNNQELGDVFFFFFCKENNRQFFLHIF